MEHVVLGHELLLLACSHCHRKRGSRHAGATPLDRLPMHAPSKPWSTQCWCQTLFSWSAWHGQCLTILCEPGEAPPLSGFETYNQIVRHLASKAYKECICTALCVHLPPLCMEVTTSKMESPDSKKHTRPQHYTMTQDMREEFMGSYSTS